MTNPIIKPEQVDVPGILQWGLAVDRPTATGSGLYYYETDTPGLFQDQGTWVSVGGSGGGGVAWGSITGTLSDQTDLQSALNAKLASVTKDATLTGDGTSGSPLGIIADFVTNSNDIFALIGVGASGWTGTINGTPSGVTVTYTNVSGNKNTLVPSSTSQLGKQRLYNTTRGTNALISTSNGTSTITLTASVPAGWASGDTITTISPTVASGQNHVDIEITAGELLSKSNVWIWAVMLDSGGVVLLRFHPFAAFSAAKQFNIFTPAAAVAFGGLQAYKLNSNILTIAWSASGAATASPTVRQVGFVK